MRDLKACVTSCLKSRTIRRRLGFSRNCKYARFIDALLLRSISRPDFFRSNSLIAYETWWRMGRVIRLNVGGILSASRGLYSDVIAELGES